MILTELFDAPHQKGVMFSACLRLNAKPLRISRTLTQIGLIGMAVLMTPQIADLVQYLKSL